MISLRGTADWRLGMRVQSSAGTFVRDAVVVALAYVLAEVWRFSAQVPLPYAHALVIAIPLVVAVFVSFEYCYGIHRRMWKYAGISDFRALTQATLWSIVFIGALDYAVPGQRPLPGSVVPVGGIFALAGMIGIRFWPTLLRSRRNRSASCERVLIVGAGEAGQHVAAELLAHADSGQRPIGFLDDAVKPRMRIHGLEVLGTIDDLPTIAAERAIDVIGIAIASASKKELDRILALAHSTSARIQVVPSRGDILSGRADLRLRDINLDDLLDRVPATSPDETETVSRSLLGRTVLVTGSRGSIGAELCRQILQFGPARLVAVDNNETGLVYLQQDLADDPHASRLCPVLADVTDPRKMEQIFQRYRPDVVFHAAAYKHVPMLEQFPEEAVFVNVYGTLNLCRLAASYKCERFVFISTDKAVHPVGVLGFSKRIGELIVRAHQSQHSAFCSVRFGNVVGSRGSALPEFIRQIDAGGPVTVTHPEVERYFMTIPEAVNLVIQAGAFASGGELFMLDMGKPMKIDTLVKRLIRLRGLRVGKDIEIAYTGLRPGEKMSEELVFEMEETHPTDNPEIFSVEDALRPDMDELTRQIDELLEIANRGDLDRLRLALAALATGEPVWPACELGAAG